MTSEKVVVVNDSGIHARPATQLVQKASQFPCDLFITKGEKQVNLKSIMGVMSLAVKKGDEVTISAQGPDEQQAVQAIVDLIKNGLQG